MKPFMDSLRRIRQFLRLKPYTGIGRPTLAEGAEKAAFTGRGKHTEEYADSTYSEQIPTMKPID